MAVTFSFIAMNFFELKWNVVDGGVTIIFFVCASKKNFFGYLKNIIF